MKHLATRFNICIVTSNNFTLTGKIGVWQVIKVQVLKIKKKYLLINGHTTHAHNTKAI